MSKKKRIRSRVLKNCLIAALAITTIGASSMIVSAADLDLTPGNSHTTYGLGTNENGTIRKWTPTNGTEGDYRSPTAKDRCRISYYGVDKYKINKSDVKVVAYHIIEANYNNTGFLGWTETKAAFDIEPLASFEDAQSNVVQVVVEDAYKYLTKEGIRTETDTGIENPTYNGSKVLTSDNITNLSRALLKSETAAAFTDKVELTWNEGAQCYESSNAKPGTYLVLVEKEDRGNIYNPVIISNDYASANIAESLSNYIPETGPEIPTNAIHNDPQFGFTTKEYETGINKSNKNTTTISAFVAYGTDNPYASDKPDGINGKVNESLFTNDNKDTAPQDQTNYKNSHSSVVYVKDTQLSGHVYSLNKDTMTYNSTTGNFDSKNADGKTVVETMALKSEDPGVAYAKKSSAQVEKNIRKASVDISYAQIVPGPDGAQGKPLAYSKYDDVSEGDTVNFDLFTKIPSYAEGYFRDEQKFVFRLTDTQHKGLAAVKAENIKVYVGNSSRTDSQEIADDLINGAYENGANKVNPLNASDDTYKVTIDSKNNKFSVDFAKDFCLSHQGQAVIVSYETTVTSNAFLGTVGNKNEVFLEYTTVPTTPDNRSYRGYKFDFTVHYTFSPTAFKLAENGSVESVNGSTTAYVDTENQAGIASGERVAKPLAGAKFKLQRVGSHYGYRDKSPADGKYYDSGRLSDLLKTGYTVYDPEKWVSEDESDPRLAMNGYQTWYLTSDKNGLIKFNSAFDGIDEGLYTLQEVEAPAGYTINPRIYMIDILPEYDESAQRFIGTDIKMGAANLDKDGNIINFTMDQATFVDGTNYDYDAYGRLIKSYKYSEWASTQDSFKRSDSLSTYTAVADGTTKHVTTISYNLEHDKAEVKTDLIGIVNTKLTRLPSTGGVGTIAFTIGGFAIMGGVVLFMAKKKKKKSDEE